jgi:hypothetical protein
MTSVKNHLPLFENRDKAPNKEKFYLSEIDLGLKKPQPSYFLSEPFLSPTLKWDQFNLFISGNWALQQPKTQFFDLLGDGNNALIFPFQVTPLPTPAQKAPITAAEAKSLLQFFNDSVQRSGESSYPLSEGARGTEDVVADISYFGRTLAQLGVDSPTYQAIGVTTGENLFMGLYAAYKAWDRFQKADQIGDAQGKIEGGLDGARGIAQGIGGGFYLGYRGGMIASEIAHVNATMTATTALGKATFYTGLAGNLFFTLFYLFIALWGGYQLCLTGRFYHQLNQVKGLVPFLLGQMHADLPQRLEKWKGADRDKLGALKTRWENRCLNEFTHRFEVWQNQRIKEGTFEGKVLSREEIQGLIKALFASIDNNHLAKATYRNEYYDQLGIDPLEAAFLNLSPMQLCGLKLEEASRQQRKEARLERVMGGKAVEQIKKAYQRGLAERLTSDDPLIQQTAELEAAALEKRVRSELVKNLIVMSSFLWMGLLGVVVSVLTIGLFTLSPIGMCAATILTLLLALSMAGIDIYFWKSALKSGAPGRYDQLFIGIITAILVGALGLSAFLTFGLGFPVVPFILTMVIGLITLGVCVYTLVQLQARKKAYRLEHPDLEQMEKVLAPFQDQELDERTVALFKKLSRPDRHAIRTWYDAKRERLRFRTEKYAKLAQGGDFAGKYLEQVTQLITGPTEKEKGILLRAAKKTAKSYWEKWHHHGDKQSQQRALHLHRLIEVLTEGHNVGLKLQLKRIQEDKKLYAAFRAHLTYLCKREENGRDLQEAIQAVRSEKQQSKSQINRQQMAKIQEIYTVHFRSAA